MSLTKRRPRPTLYVTAAPCSGRAERGPSRIREHGPLFGRVELIAVLDGVIRRLDLKDEATRAKINRAGTTDALTLVFGG
jgi:hypothetical protein